MKDTVTLRITDDFDLDRIANSGQCFRWSRIDADTYRILHGAECLYVTKHSDDTLCFACTQAQFDAIWRPYFDLDEDYGSIRARIDREKDPFLWDAAAYESGIRILRQDPWEMLVTFIISQRKKIPAIQSAVELLCAACGEKKYDTRGLPYYAFPSPDEILSLSAEELNSCALGYRGKYVRAAAEAVLLDGFDLEKLREADERNTITELIRLYGVGNKVANCVSLFGLHHSDAFPRDVWINRILATEYPNGYPFASYSPYNGIYQQYMFAYYRHRQHH